MNNLEKPNLIDRFTNNAIKVIALAQDENRRLGHNFVGTEQLLLGLIRDRSGIASNILQTAGINLQTARAEVERIIGQGDALVDPDFPFTPRAMRALKISWDQAQQAGDKFVCTEHVLLGVIGVDGVGLHIMQRLGDPAEISRSVWGVLLTRAARLPDAPQVMFKDFSEESKTVFEFAEDATRVLGHSFIGTEHILIGLIREEHGFGGLALRRAGVELESLKSEVKRLIGSGSGLPGKQVLFSSRTRRVVDRAAEMQILEKARWVSTDLLLQAVLLEREGVAVIALNNLNISCADVLSVLKPVTQERQSADSLSERSGCHGRLVTEESLVIFSLCPNCAEPVKPKALICYGCKYGISDKHFQSCPFCKERIRKESVKCHYCRSQIHAGSV